MGTVKMPMCYCRLINIDKNCCEQNVHDFAKKRTFNFIQSAIAILLVVELYNLQFFSP